MTISNLHDSGGQERLARSTPQGRRGHNTATEQVYLQSPVPGTGLVSILLAVPLVFNALWRDKDVAGQAVPSLPLMTCRDPPPYPAKQAHAWTANPAKVPNCTFSQRSYLQKVYKIVKMAFLGVSETSGKRNLTYEDAIALSSQK